MSTDPLVALLEREGLVPAARLDEARARQQLAGGGFDTALLELGVLKEREILEKMALAHGVRCVSRAELGEADRGLASVLPRRLAEKHRIAPLRHDGRTLTVAICTTPNRRAIDEIAFMVSLAVVPLVTTEANIAWALSRLYDVAVPERLRAVLERIREEPVSTPASPEAWRTSAAPGSHLTPPVPASEAPTNADVPLRSPPDDESGWQVGARVGLARGAPSAPRLEVLAGGSLEAQATASALSAGPTADTAESRRAERVLWTVDDAIAELALADDRDAMLDVVLRFAYRRLSTVAMFILTRSSTNSSQVFVGWDVIDPLLARTDISKFELPRDGGHALAQVFEMKSPFLGPLKTDDPLVRLFGRRARAVVLLPVLVGDRLLGAMYGDAAERAIPPSTLAELQMVIPRLGKGIGNLIQRRKRATGPSPAALQAAGDDARPATTPGQDDSGGLPVTDVRSNTELARSESLVVPENISNELWGPRVLDGASLYLPWAWGAATPDPHPMPGGSAGPVVARGPLSLPNPDVMPAPEQGASARSIDPSPGVAASETALLEVHASWLRHPDPGMDALVAKLHRPDEPRRLDDIDAVVQHGSRALPSLARAFPGELSVRPFGLMGGRPAVEDLSECLACFTRLGPHHAAPVLCAELAHADRGHRWAAVWALSTLRVPAALPRLMQRIFDPESTIASLALEVLDIYRSEAAFESLLGPVRGLLRRGDDFERERAVIAVGHLRDRAALPDLVELLGTRPRIIAEEACRALIAITKQDFGLAEKRWRGWIAENASAPRTRWLIDGLEAREDHIRRSSQAELLAETGEHFGYRWDAELSSRESSIVQWRAWWEEAQRTPGRWP